MKHIDLYESKQRGTREFPIEVYVVDKQHPEYIMPAHWHNEFELIRVLDGKLELFINNKSMELQSGDIAFINYKELHRAIPTECKYECIVFDLNLIRDINKDIYLSYIEPLVIGTFEIKNLLDNRNTEIKDIINDLFEALKAKKPFFKLRVLSNIYSMIEYFYTKELVIENITSKKLIKQSSIVTELMSWIDKNYAESITLPLLASRAGLSQSYLCKIFRDYTGKSPIEYVNAVRIENICLEINEGKKDITAIATNNGYNDISYFCKVFKKYVGVSAKKYAKLGIGKN